MTWLLNEWWGKYTAGYTFHPYLDYVEIECDFGVRVCYIPFYWNNAKVIVKS